MAQAKRAVESVRVVQPGVFVEGSFTGLLRSSGKGNHNGWSLAETSSGVLAEKGGKAMLLPWPQVQQVDYSDA